MLKDLDLNLSDKQAITATANSTNVIDLSGVNGVDPSIGGDLQLNFSVDEAFNNLTSLKVDVNSSDDEAFGTSVTLYSQTILLAGLTKGAKIPFPEIPEGCKRYLRATYTVTGTAPTTGKVSLDVAQRRDQFQVTPDYRSN